jgi:hypothetical protein
MSQEQKNREAARRGIQEAQEVARSLAHRLDPDVRLENRPDAEREARELADAAWQIIEKVGLPQHRTDDERRFVIWRRGEDVNRVGQGGVYDEPSTAWFPACEEPIVAGKPGYALDAAIRRGDDPDDEEVLPFLDGEIIAIHEMIVPGLLDPAGPLFIEIVHRPRFKALPLTKSPVPGVTKEART